MTLPAPYYQDDLITLYHSDWQNVLPHLPTETIADMVIVTDPPFGQAFASNKQGALDPDGIVGDEDTTARDNLIAWARPETPALMFGTWKAPRPNNVKQVLVWDKGNCPGMGDLNLPWGPSHEEIYVMGNGWILGNNKRTGSVIRTQAPVTWKSHRSGRVHPTEKPVPLMRHLIERCPPGTIIDPYAGSGSTLRAAKDLGRKAIGIEIDERWLDGAVRKLSQDNLFTEAT